MVETAAGIIDYLPRVRATVMVRLPHNVPAIVWASVWRLRRMRAHATSGISPTRGTVAAPARLHISTANDAAAVVWTLIFQRSVTMKEGGKANAEQQLRG